MLSSNILSRYSNASIRIGLLGGSFNPPHAGHVAISHHAWTHLGLHCVWWMVSPQNPLKSSRETMPLAGRVAAARAITKGKPWIIITDIEKKLGTRFTVDTVIALKKHLPRAQFVWLMGADNLISLPAWEGWEKLAHEVPMAIFRRPAYPCGYGQGKAAQRLARGFLPAEHARRLFTNNKLPAWTILDNRLSPLSSTKLRAAL